MALNFYYNNFSNSGEQNLIEDLIVESLRIYGIDVWYIPHKKGSLDDLLNEDDTPIFDQAFSIEMYIKSVDGFQGDGDFLSKFGLQIRDSMTITMSMRRYEGEIGVNTQKTRPQEGDLIYFPLNGKIFEVSKVEHEAIFYQMGKLQTYDLNVELLEYSNEIFKTGIPEIDSWTAKMITTADNTIDGIESVDHLADNLTIELEANTILDFTETNPFGDDRY